MWRCCRCACQITERSGKFEPESCGSETSRDLAIWLPSVKWLEALTGWPHRHRGGLTITVVPVQQCWKLRIILFLHELLVKTTTKNTDNLLCQHFVDYTLWRNCFETPECLCDIFITPVFLRRRCRPWLIAVLHKQCLFKIQIAHPWKFELSIHYNCLISTMELLKLVWHLPYCTGTSIQLVWRWYWNTIPVDIRQYCGCVLLGFLHLRSSTYVVLTRKDKGDVYSNCAIWVWTNDMKSKYIFMFH